MEQHDEAAALKYKRRLETQLGEIFPDLPPVVTGATTAEIYGKAREVAHKMLQEHIQKEESKLGEACGTFAMNI